MKQERNQSRSRNRVKYSTSGLRILTAIALGVLFSTSSIAFAADNLAWDKPFPQSVVYHTYSTYARGVGASGACPSSSSRSRCLRHSKCQKELIGEKDERR